MLGTRRGHEMDLLGARQTLDVPYASLVPSTFAELRMFFLSRFMLLASVACVGQVPDSDGVAFWKS